MKIRFLLVLLAAAALSVVAVQAHHPFAAEFDVNKQVTLQGTLAKMEWVNPHGWIYLDVKGADGAVKQWTIEASGPNQMNRRGLKKTDVVHGMSITVKGYQHRRDPLLANGRTLVLPDGRSFYIGSVGGPNDGADK